MTDHVWKYLSLDLLVVGIDVFLFGLLLAWSVGFLARHGRIAVVTGMVVCVMGGCVRLREELACRI